jgi:hypothetical protein
MMAVKRGSTVVFGNGKKKKVAAVGKHSNQFYTVSLSFEDGTKRSYTEKLTHHYGTQNHDIVKVM